MARVHRLRYKVHPVKYGHLRSQIIIIFSNSLPHGSCRKELRINAAGVISNKKQYLHDILVSCSTEQDLIQTQSQLVELLHMGSFQLHKWASNCKCNLDNVPKDSHYIGEVELQKGNVFVKTLGIHFDVKADVFKSTYPEPYSSTNDSKRDILSHISKFYDPMGLIGPIFKKHNNS